MKECDCGLCYNGIPKSEVKLKLSHEQLQMLLQLQGAFEKDTLAATVRQCIENEYKRVLE